MPRQKKSRNIENPPIYDGYKPIGIPSANLDSISLQLEEYEAIRLADYENLKQEDAAKSMNVSRPTFTRIYNSARKKIAQSFVEGKTLLFKGGNINIDVQWYKCKDCNEVFKLTSESKTKCTTCNSSNIENLKENLENWQEEQLQTKCKKGNAVCVYCGYKLRTNKKENSCPQCGNRMQLITEEINTNMKKIAIPVENGNLCTHFGGAKQFQISEIQDDKIVKTDILDAPKHEPGVLPKWLGSLNVTDVLAGGMGERAITLLEQNNIKAHTGVSADTIENILNKFINGSLVITFAKCNHDHGHGEHDNCGNH